MLTRQDLDYIFLLKYGKFETLGWSPKKRIAAGYYLPSDFYEALVRKFVDVDTCWLDVGGGGSLFPHNSELCKKLAAIAKQIVCVDPSDNVLQNADADLKFQSTLEDFKHEARFDLATMRMVAEHVQNPLEVVRKLNELLRIGGNVIIFTVNLWSPITIISRLLPFRLHYPIKKLFFDGEEKDTFPTVYKMNTRKRLKSLFEMNGFRESQFQYVDDLSALGNFKLLNAMELWIWKTWRRLSLAYPENCILAVYEKCSEN